MSTQLATFAGGCYWCIEAIFEQLKGVEKVVSGFSGGHVKNPSYREVCDGTTGHAEVVQVTFDPAVIPYQELLDFFFAFHDPTTLNRQGADVGTQYRSAIFYHSPEQKAEAEATIARLTRDAVFDSPIVTEVTAFDVFYPADFKHQGYYRANSDQPYCRATITPKVTKLRQKYAARLKSAATPGLIARMAKRPAGRSTPAKDYDRSYFDRWYRDPAQAVILGTHLERRVGLAVAAAEYVLERRIESVLDIGCGEASWRAIVKRLRPRVRYSGLDPSPYVVGRFGRRRGIALGGVGDLGTPALARALLTLGARPPFDLIVCSDVLHYVPTPDLARGLKAIGKWLGGGMAFLEFFTRDDDTEGDTEDFQARPAATYARLLRAAGLTHLGLHCYVGRDVGREIMAFERGFAAPPPRGGARR